MINEPIFLKYVGSSIYLLLGSRLKIRVSLNGIGGITLDYQYEILFGVKPHKSVNHITLWEVLHSHVA